MVINVEISGNSKYFYTTTEKCLRCPNCKRYYKSKKYCQHCKIENKPFIKTHTGIITKDLKQYSCSCIFSSWYRFGKHWKDNYPNSRCKHCKVAMKKIEELDKIVKNKAGE